MSINSYLAKLQNELYVNGNEREKIRKCQKNLKNTN